LWVSPTRNLPKMTQKCRFLPCFRGTWVKLFTKLFTHSPHLFLLFPQEKLYNFSILSTGSNFGEYYREDLANVEKNLKSAIELYLDDVRNHPGTVVSSIPTDEFIEFLKDTQPEWYKEPADGLILRPLELHEVPSYA